MKKLMVKNLHTKKMFEFICFLESKEYKGYFIYRIIPLEASFDMGHCSFFEPIGITWEELKNEIN